MADSKNRVVIRPATLALFVARRNSGKSVLMAHLLAVLARASCFHWVAVVSPTMHTGEWAAIVGPENVREAFDPEWLDSVLERQAEARRKKKPNPGLLILDDCLGRVNFHSDIITRLATAGRHYDLTVWAAFQLYHKVPTVLRENADYTFLLGSISDKVARAVFEEYGPPGHETPASVRAFANAATEGHGACLVDRTDDSRLKVVRAPWPAPSFRLAVKAGRRRKA